MRNRLAELQEAAEIFEKRLRAEEMEASSAAQRMEENFRAVIASLHSSLEEEVRGVFDRFDADVPPLATRATEIKEEMEGFFAKRLPSAMAGQSGEVSLLCSTGE